MLLLVRTGDYKSLFIVLMDIEMHEIVTVRSRHSVTSVCLRVGLFVSLFTLFYDFQKYFNSTRVLNL